MITNLMEAIRNGYNSNGKYQSFLVGMTGKDARDILQEYEDMQKELADLRAAQRPDSARQVEFARGVIDEQYERIDDLERDNTQLHQARDQLIKTTQDLMGVIRERDHEIAEVKREVRGLQMQVAHKDEVIEAITKANDELSAKVREFTKTIVGLNNSNRQLSQRLLETNSRDNERIKALQEQLDYERKNRGDNTPIHQLRYEVQRLTEVEIDLRKKLQKKDKVIEGLQKGLRAKSEVIRNLNARLGHMAEPNSLAIVIHSLTEED